MPNRGDSPSHVPVPGHQAGSAQYPLPGQEGPVFPPPPSRAVPDPGAARHDPPGPGPQEDAFERLPDHAKEMFLQDEREQDLRLRDIEQRRRVTMKRYMLEGMVIFTIAGIFGGPVGWAVGAVFGAGVGCFAWQRGGGNSFGWVGSLGYLIWYFLTPWGSFYSAFLIIGMCGLVGVAHRLQKFDGSEC